MVRGIANFRKYFRGFEEQYVIIGGTACDLIMENEEMSFRATKDIDLVLIVEALTADFGRKFWEFVKDAGYEHCNNSTGEVQFYRFTMPKSKDYPYMIELFSKKPNNLFLDDHARITPLHIDEEISSLSAILLNEAYYGLLQSGKTMVDGVSVLDAVCLIPFKAKAWLDLSSRKDNGERIDSKNIRKHKNDVFRLAQLISEERKTLDIDIKQDMEIFLERMEKESVDLDSIGVLGSSKEQLLNRLRQCFEIKQSSLRSPALK